VRLRHLGNVTAVFSTCRRHDGPKQTKILLTNLPEIAPARHIVAIYLRRWWVEISQPYCGSREHLYFTAA
jgi:hypothetical protein